MAHFKVPKRVIFVASLLKRELRQRFETLEKALQKSLGTWRGKVNFDALYGASCRNGAKHLC